MTRIDTARAATNIDKSILGAISDGYGDHLNTIEIELCQHVEHWPAERLRQLRHER